MTTAEPAADAAGVNGQLVVDWFVLFDRVITENAPWLTMLDTAIGDGDHGTIMRKGANATRRDVQATPGAGAGQLMAQVGTTFGDATGGAGGILFATLFQGIATRLDDRSSVSITDFADAFAAGVTRVQDRGRAGLGDKTMIDALLPAARSLQSAAAENVPLHVALACAATSAAAGRDATYALVARRGRASYLGERSENHVDPGAATAALLLQSLTNSATPPA